MIELFKQNMSWKILSYFIEHPTQAIYVKEMSRLLKISPSGTNQSLKFLESAKLLMKEEKGKAHYYTLNNDLSIVHYIKIAYFLARLDDLDIAERFKHKDDSLISLAIYGSYATGKFDEKSDVDILIISSKKKNYFLKEISELEKFLNIEVNVEIFNIASWQKLKDKNDNFYMEVTSNYVLLFGSELI